MAIHGLEPWTVSFHRNPPWRRPLPIEPQSSLLQRPLCTPSHNRHQVCCHQAKDSPCGTSWSSHFCPQPLARSSLQASTLFSSSEAPSSAWMSKSLRARQPWSRRRPVDPPKPSLVVLHLRLCFPTLRCLGTSLRPSTCLAQHGTSAVKLPAFCFPKRPCPVAEWTQYQQPYKTATNHNNHNNSSGHCRRRSWVCSFYIPFQESSELPTSYTWRNSLYLDCWGTHEC